MKGTINRIVEKEDKGYWQVEIDGQNYSLWDAKHLSGLQEGDTVDYTWKQSGNFRNITGLRKLDPGDNSGKPSSGRDLRIVRMSCLKSATAIASSLDTESDKADYVLSAAKKFEKYILDRKDESESGPY